MTVLFPILLVVGIVMVIVHFATTREVVIPCPAKCDKGIITIRISEDPASRVLSREICWVCNGSGTIRRSIPNI